MRSDPTYSKRLRPLVPRPLTSNSEFSSTLSLHNRIIPSWNQPLCGVSGYGGSGRREMRVMSSRWNPTPEQLQALEDMYRRGTKTPSSDQIQHIAAKLRRFGRIEGKNVFYWFQNHKARDRQKKRRQSSLPPKYHHHADAHLPKPSSGLSCGCSEIEHPKKLPTKSNCTTPSRNSGSMRGEVVHECTIHELQHHFTNEKATSQENAHSLVTLNLCKLLPPKNDHYFLSHEIEEDQTLELFPITGSNLSTVDVVKDKMSYDGSSLGTRLVPNQFFEFLPTKN